MTYFIARRLIVSIIRPMVWMALAPCLFSIACASRLIPKRNDIALGPHPLINNIYHKKSLELYGYKAVTFVDSVYYITDEFDIRFDRYFKGVFSWIASIMAYVYVVCACKCLYIYFNGGPLHCSGILRRLEPWLYHLAGTRVVVMPYGSDVQDMRRTENLLFKHAMIADYPLHSQRGAFVAANVERWCKHANHVISGCDWVDYMNYWDTLMLAHFSIDTELWKAPSGMLSKRPRSDGKPVRILHAPNHRKLKGTLHFVEAVDALKAEGYGVELILLEGVSNERVRETMRDVDLVADQLLVGWYAMFAIEAMAMEKPVLCYLRQDLLDLYSQAELIEKDEIPIINCTPFNVRHVLRGLLDRPSEFTEIGLRSRRFVIKHHSIEPIGRIFDRINRSIGIMPSNSHQLAPL